MYISLDKRDFSSSNGGITLSTTGIISICIIVVLVITAIGSLCLADARTRGQRKPDREQRRQGPRRSAQPSDRNSQSLANSPVKSPPRAHVLDKGYAPLNSEPPPAYQA
ncbi:hypothetical protein Z517_12360 [Fonsecaea pedrosoi CBS 271.37]|uniref:Unplaced genomic scaffold supercont1.9, whole genome shotgun sequence n=1 Tax=Fonsecaea pedrosoi CBS 271.37 TaxID=1442368 RepID=A0A0D2G6S5_9EURO|nr:uncharacterized protein Z517_12360 [Fonsecaea pedrosoi CBS 271.37]KIW74420.1 hypothetical protein Z517_12360 [Fonsecaea pedrosoi CBS 271.37]